MKDYPAITDNIKLKDLVHLLKIHFYIKMIEKDIDVKNFSDRELTILCELYKFGGLLSKSDLEVFTNLCKNKGLTDNSVQSVRNVLSKARSLKLVKRPKANKWAITSEFLPKIDSDKIIFKYTIHNLDI